MNPIRRRIVFTGLAGAAALAAVRWLQPDAVRLDSHDSTLSADGAEILHALVPALLGPVLPRETHERNVAVDETMAAIRKAIGSLPPSTREELGALFATLALPPVRIAFAGIDTRWRDAGVAEANAFLERLRASRWPVKRSIYAALHQLTFAAWYASPLAWPAIGYPGPPRLDAG